MANNYFQFRQFCVWQGRCAMKVGTDGTLLGAWAHGGPRILDIGTGTALIALMMAQRFPAAEVVGIDIDADAVAQARENVAKSPFASRVMVGQADVAGYCAEPFHAIVTNPPYFVDALTCPDPQRTAARHAASLPYAVLMDAAWRLLRDDGELSIIIPFDCKSELLSEALLRGFFVSCDCAVRTTPRKQPKRFLLAFRKHPSAQVETGCFSLEEPAGVRSPWYAELTKDFYL